MRWFVAFTPLLGVIIFPLVVPFIMSRLVLASGVGAALILSTFWFVAMLRTSEMPH